MSRRRKSENISVSKTPVNSPRKVELLFDPHNVDRGVIVPCINGIRPHGGYRGKERKIIIMY